MIEKLDEGLKQFILKIAIPSLAAISIKLAIQSKRAKISLFTATMSIIIGICSAYLSSKLVLVNFSTEWVPVVIAVITITGEKIGSYLMFKFAVDDLIDTFLQVLITRFKK